VIYNIPVGSSGLPTGVPRNKTLDDSSLQGKNDLGRIGYNDPARRRARHTGISSRYTPWILHLSLKSGATKCRLEAAMLGHILAQVEMIGKYRR